MDRNSAKKIAEKYAKSIHEIFDIVSFAGERDNGYYFIIESTQMYGKKTGLPRVVKINQKGSVLPIQEFKTIIWAIHNIKASEK